MNILDPSQAEHQLKIIPRYYAEGELILNLYNEEKQLKTSIEVTPITVDGFMYIDFEQEVLNNTNFQIEILEGTEVVYRGKAFATDQYNDTQNYKISKGVFTYE